MEEHYRKRLVSNARAIITNQIAIPLGAVRMNKIMFRAGKSNAFQGIDLSLFTEYSDQYNGCPVGTERLLWDKEALREQDKHLDELTSRYKNQIIDKCFEIITFFQ